MSKRRSWSQGDVREARSLQQELGDLLRTDPFTRESMQAVTRLCDRAMVTVDDEYCQEIFAELDRQAHDLFRTGARNRTVIRIALEAIDCRLGSLETMRGAGNTVARAREVLAKY
jgi:hypothetical protein